MSTDRITITQAQADIVRYCGNVRIVERASAIYDFVVQERTQGLMFGVKVFSTTFETTALFNEYKNTVDATDLYDIRYNMPIILMAVNSNACKSYFGILVSWNREKPIVYNRVSIRESNDKNWGIVLDHILSMNDAICMLSKYGINIKKTIKIETVGVDGIPSFGEIVYLRNFSDKYKMKQRIVKNEKERFERLLYGIPEDEYPSDIIDEYIEDAIDKTWSIIPFHGSKTRSDSVLFTTDLKELQVYKKTFPVHINIAIQPSWGDIPQDILPLLEGLEIATIPATIYCQSNKDADSFRERLLHCELPLEEWKNKAEEIKRLKQSVHQLNEYFV